MHIKIIIIDCYRPVRTVFFLKNKVVSSFGMFMEQFMEFPLLQCWCTQLDRRKNFFLLSIPVFLEPGSLLSSNVIITYTMLILWPQRHQIALRSQTGWSRISRGRIWTQASNSKVRVLSHWPRLSCSKYGSRYLILNHIFIFISLSNSWPLWFRHGWTAWWEDQFPGLQQRDGRNQVVFPLQGQTFSHETLGSREPSPTLSWTKPSPIPSRSVLTPSSDRSPVSWG